MATVSITFTGSNKTPYLPGDNVNGGNFTSRRSDALLSSNTWLCTTDALWSCDVDPGNIFSAQSTFTVVDSNARGIVIFNSSGNGFIFLVTNTNTRVFALAVWALSGSALATYASTFGASSVLNIDVTQSTGTYVVKQGTTTIGTYVNTTYTSGLKAGITSRNGGAIASFALTYTPAFTIDTLTTPLVCAATFSGTSTGFANGAATLSFGGVSASVTIASGAFSGTIPMLADNVAWPKLPATAQTITLTQGASTATISRDISLPVGYDTVRDGSNNPANFAGIVTGDATYLGKAFNDAGNPLTTNDTWVYPYAMVLNPATSVVEKDLIVYQDSAISVLSHTLPRTDGHFRYEGATGKYFAHSVTLNNAGEIVSPGSGSRGIIKPMFKNIIKNIIH